MGQMVVMIIPTIIITINFFVAIASTELIDYVNNHV